MVLQSCDIASVLTVLRGRHSHRRGCEREVLFQSSTASQGTSNVRNETYPQHLHCAQYLSRTVFTSPHSLPQLGHGISDLLQIDKSSMLITPYPLQLLLSQSSCRECHSRSNAGASIPIRHAALEYNVALEIAADCFGYYGLYNF